MSLIVDEKQEMLNRKRRKAKWKWLLAYTLVNNPEISLQRRLVLAKERNENVKEIFFSHSTLYSEEPGPNNHTGRKIVAKQAQMYHAAV